MVSPVIMLHLIKEKYLVLEMRQQMKLFIFLQQLKKPGFEIWLQMDKREHTHGHGHTRTWTHTHGHTRKHGHTRTHSHIRTHMDTQTHGHASAISVSSFRKSILDLWTFHKFVKCRD